MMSDLTSKQADTIALFRGFGIEAKPFDGEFPVSADGRPMPPEPDESNPPRLSKAQKDALLWLDVHGGDGVFVRGDRVLAEGSIAPHRGKTWKALIDAGACEAYRAGKGRRLRVTGKDHAP